jgi:hypothetical protein
VKCGKASKFHRIKGRPAYSCQFCGVTYKTAHRMFKQIRTPVGQDADERLL